MIRKELTIEGLFLPTEVWDDLGVAEAEQGPEVEIQTYRFHRHIFVYPAGENAYFVRTVDGPWYYLRGAPKPLIVRRDQNSSIWHTEEFFATVLEFQKDWNRAVTGGIEV